MSHRISLSCFLVIIFASLTSAETIGLHCWIVANNEGVSSHSYSSVTNDVIELNKIFAQVAMSFSIQSVTYTNSTHLTNIVFTNDQHIAELCSITNGTGGLEVYFVETISDYANAVRVPSGIAISSTHNRTTLAHEVGHACGLADIYESYRETNLSVTGMPCKAWLPRDWGWYPENVSQVDLIQRLLMYGYDTTSKGDISRGDVYGLSYEYTWNPTRNDWDKSWRLGVIPVGFKDHGTRQPVSL